MKNLKVCGMRDLQNINELARLEPNYIGFIFYNKSKRYVGEYFDSKIIKSIKGIKKVGVFVNSDFNYIIDKHSKYNLDYVQLHGNESPDFCKKLKAKNTNIIKAFSIDNSFDFSILDEYYLHCNYFLFDTKSENYGGSGIKFDWSVLKNYDNKKKFFLSGGIDIDDIETIKKLTNLNIHAIDINSKFEKLSGLKDIGKIGKFMSSCLF